MLWWLVNIKQLESYLQICVLISTIRSLEVCGNKKKLTQLLISLACKKTRFESDTSNAVNVNANSQTE